MPGVQRDAGAWDKFGTDSDTDSSDSRVVRVNMGESSDDEASPDEYRWLGDEREDLGAAWSVLGVFSASKKHPRPPQTNIID